MKKGNSKIMLIVVCMLIIIATISIIAGRNKNIKQKNENNQKAEQIVDGNHNITDEDLKKVLQDVDTLKAQISSYQDVQMWASELQILGDRITDTLSELQNKVVLLENPTEEELQKYTEWEMKKEDLRMELQERAELLEKIKAALE